MSETTIISGATTSSPPSAVQRLYGVGDLDAVFGGGPKAVCPWPRVGKVKGGDDVLRRHTDAVLDGPVWLSEVDPRTLHASQPWVLRRHAAYYRTGVWEVTGLTSADRDSEANRFPIVVADRLGRLVIRTGHHRALAALVEGRPLRCRLAPDGDDAAVAVLPRLLVGSSTRLEHERCDDADAAVESVRAGITVLCADAAVAEAACAALVPAGFLGGAR